MPLPLPSQVHIDRPLTNMSVAFMQSQLDFVATQIFPIVPSDKQSDKYFTFDRSYWFRENVARRAPGTAAVQGGYPVGNDSFDCGAPWAIAKPTDDQVSRNADSPLNLDRTDSEWVARQHLIKKEKDFATNFFATGKWSKEVTGTTGTPTLDTSFKQWDQSAATPMADIDHARTVIKELTGFKPNIMVLPDHVLNALKNSSDVRDRTKYVSGDAVTIQILAKLLELDAIYVPGAVQNTAIEGQTAAYSFVLGKHALLLYRPPSPGIEIPAAGYTFAWTGLTGGTAQNGFQVTRYRSIDGHIQYTEGQWAWVHKQVSADLGYFFLNAVA